MSLHFHKLGRGPDILLAFHGIEQNGLSCFKSFEEILGDHYTIYAFDLFFHGKSQNGNPDLVTKNLWTETIQDFLVKNSISQFDIAGFSIGGRFALATLEVFPDQINNVFLIAPDGISEHPIYSLATRFSPGRALFRGFMEKPGFFFKVINLLKNAGLLNSSLTRFTEHVLDTPERRKTIYKSWIAFRELIFDIPAVYKLAVTKQVRIFLFTGKFDKLLKPTTVRKFADLLPPDQNIQLKSGHSQLVAQTGVWISSLFE